MNFEGRGKSTLTLVAPMLRFLLILLFQDVTIMKRLMSNNQDTRLQPLVLTIVAIIRVRVIFHIYEKCLI
jgi:hypothetical protein